MSAPRFVPGDQSRQLWEETSKTSFVVLLAGMSSIFKMAVTRARLNHGGFG
ncbi:hypothetical protein OK016_16880 [Vibrio chagasii]|nr:hypothetical protein [Vibrio chagasii]